MNKKRHEDFKANKLTWCSVVCARGLISHIWLSREDVKAIDVVAICIDVSEINERFVRFSVYDGA